MPKRNSNREFDFNRKNSQRDRRQEKITNGICTTCLCTNKVEVGLKVCADCRAVESERGKRRRMDASANGKCESCPNRAMKLNRAPRQNRLGGQYIEGRSQASYCERCYLKSRARELLGSRTHWKVLVDKLDACKWLCPYTGEKLVIGDNLSFDHMDPVSRFPEKKFDPNNIEPVSWQINVMKRDMTKDEFLALTRRICLYTTERT